MWLSYILGLRLSTNGPKPGNVEMWLPCRYLEETYETAEQKYLLDRHVSGTWRSRKRCSVTEAEGGNGIGDVTAKT